jgi:hypothetical protein
MDTDGDSRKRLRPDEQDVFADAARICDDIARGRFITADDNNAMLVRIKRTLGLGPYWRPFESLCDTLARQYGPDWRASTREGIQIPERRRVRPRIGATLRLRQQPAGPAVALVEEEEQEAAPGAAPALPFNWTFLPVELQTEIVARLADTDPRAVLALRRMSVDAASVIRSVWHPFVRARDGRLVPERIPLLDYARLAVAFRETDHVRLFLAMAECTMLDYYYRYIYRPGIPAYSALTAMQYGFVDVPAVPTHDPLGARWALLERLSVPGRARLIYSVLVSEPPPGSRDARNFMGQPVPIYLLSGSGDTAADGPHDEPLLLMGWLDPSALAEVERVLGPARETLAHGTGAGAANAGPGAQIGIPSRDRTGSRDAVRLVLGAASGVSSLGRNVPASRACSLRGNYRQYAVDLADLWTGPLLLAESPTSRDTILLGRFQSTPIGEALAITASEGDVDGASPSVVPGDGTDESALEDLYGWS